MAIIHFFSGRPPSKTFTWTNASGPIFPVTRQRSEGSSLSDSGPCPPRQCLLLPPLFSEKRFFVFFAIRFFSRCSDIR